MAGEDAPVLQMYETPPLALRIILEPLHIETVDGEIVAIGFEFTVRIVVTIESHPPDET